MGTDVYNWDATVSTMTNWDDEGEETIYAARLGTIYEALLIIIFIGVPIAMILLRCFTLKNIRKLDLFFLFFAITFWFWIIWWSFLLYHGLNQWATFRDWDTSGICWM